MGLSEKTCDCNSVHTLPSHKLPHTLPSYILHHTLPSHLPRLPRHTMGHNRERSGPPSNNERKASAQIRASGVESFGLACDVMERKGRSCDGRERGRGAVPSSDGRAGCLRGTGGSHSNAPSPQQTSLQHALLLFLQHPIRDISLSLPRRYCPTEKERKLNGRVHHSPVGDSCLDGVGKLLAQVDEVSDRNRVGILG